MVCLPWDRPQGIVVRAPGRCSRSWSWVQGPPPTNSNIPRTVTPLLTLPACLKRQYHRPSRDGRANNSGISSSKQEASSIISLRTGPVLLVLPCPSPCPPIPGGREGSGSGSNGTGGRACFLGFGGLGGFAGGRCMMLSPAGRLDADGHGPFCVRAGCGEDGMSALFTAITNNYTH